VLPRPCTERSEIQPSSCPYNSGVLICSSSWCMWLIAVSSLLGFDLSTIIAQNALDVKQF
jgi:hypothetical protein